MRGNEGGLGRQSDRHTGRRMATQDKCGGDGEHVSLTRRPRYVGTGKWRRYTEWKREPERKTENDAPTSDVDAWK